MSSLVRYKKPGGFLALVSLIETFGPQKKEKFIEMVEAESASWGRALREKMLTIERIFGWPDQVVIEVFKNLPPTSMALALEGVKPEHKARVVQFFSPSEKRRVEDALATANPKPEEIASSLVKVVEMTRKMLVKGELRAEKFDENLLMAEDIENRLEFDAPIGKPVASRPEPESSAEPPVPEMNVESHQPQVPSLEALQLQKALQVITKENKALKDEVRLLRGKLEQIKKIA